MRKIKLIGCLVLFQFMLQQCTEAEPADIVDIPDSNFLQALLDAGVDTNGDGLINETEAGIVTHINLSPAGIIELTGIAAFFNLDTLEVYVNPIASPDLSENLSLSSLTLSGCGLSVLDISKNAGLKHLDCSGNELEALDISHNPMLQKLSCWRNRIEELAQ
jgi:Leucine-rich repeat (LRR) protein